MTPLEDLKKRLEELSGVEKKFMVFQIAEDAIRLAGIYRGIALNRGLPLTREMIARLDDEASKLFKGEDGVK